MQTKARMSRSKATQGLSDEERLVARFDKAELQQIVLNVTKMNYYEIVDMFGKGVCSIKTTADFDLIHKVYNNLRQINGHCNIESLLIELEDRGYYATRYEKELIQLPMI